MINLIVDNNIQIFYNRITVKLIPYFGIFNNLCIIFGFCCGCNSKVYSLRIVLSGCHSIVKCCQCLRVHLCLKRSQTFKVFKITENCISICFWCLVAKRFIVGKANIYIPCVIGIFEIFCIVQNFSGRCEIILKFKNFLYHIL